MCDPFLGVFLLGWSKEDVIKINARGAVLLMGRRNY